MRWSFCWLLTTNWIAFMEYSSNLWIKGDQHILFRFDLIVSLLDSSIDPLRELLTTFGEYNIGNILPWKLFDLFINRKASHHKRPFTSIIKHILDWKTFKLGNWQVFDFTGRNHGLLATCNVSQMPNGDWFIAREICLTVTSKKSVYFLLALELWSKCWSSDIFLHLSIVGRWYLICHNRYF